MMPETNFNAIRSFIALIFYLWYYITLAARGKWPRTNLCVHLQAPRIFNGADTFSKCPTSKAGKRIPRFLVRKAEPRRWGKTTRERVTANPADISEMFN